ncbi:MAG: undecaprenyl-phosphate glucose phosphotransferase [Anaerolineae bacterium]|nr:undecaprenyl-phosphate glucose phosphotransferase [Anaerolineae bacterium]
MSVKRDRLRPWAYAKPVVDAALVALAFVLAYYVRYRLQWWREVEPTFYVPLSRYVPSMLGLVALIVLFLAAEGAYRHARGRRYVEEMIVVFRGVILGIATMTIIVFFATPSYYSRLILGYTGVACVLLLGVGRAVEQTALARLRQRGVGVASLLVVGADDVGRSVMQTICARPDLAYRIVGFLDDDPARAACDIGRFPALGGTDRLGEMLGHSQVDTVIVTLPWDRPRQIRQIVETCRAHGVRVQVVPDMFQMSVARVAVEDLGGIPLLSLREPSLQTWRRIAKRVMDVCIAATGLVVLSPLMGLIALAIRLDSPGPIIFRQRRVGRGGRAFTLFKFRSMFEGAEQKVATLKSQNQADGPIFKLKDDPRCTRVGKWIRRASLDELPQLWNVLCGDMSLVGPRPPLESEVSGYAPWHRRRLDALPGITGLWQVSGRSELTFDEMVLLDIYYIENWSPALDLRILLRTVPTVLKGTGAY